MLGKVATHVFTTPVYVPQTWTFSKRNILSYCCRNSRFIHPVCKPCMCRCLLSVSSCILNCSKTQQQRHHLPPLLSLPLPLQFKCISLLFLFTFDYYHLISISPVFPEIPVGSAPSVLFTLAHERLSRHHTRPDCLCINQFHARQTFQSSSQCFFSTPMHYLLGTFVVIY